MDVRPKSSSSGKYVNSKSGKETDRSIEINMQSHHSEAIKHQNQRGILKSQQGERITELSIKRQDQTDSHSLNSGNEIQRENGTVSARHKDETAAHLESYDKQNYLSRKAHNTSQQKALGRPISFRKKKKAQLYSKKSAH